MKKSITPGVYSIHWFSLLNAVSFQIILGAPIILYSKSLGATSTVVGILASFTPLMTVLQLPAAKWLPVYGYKPFILMGWGLRTIFIFIVAAVPLLSFLHDVSKLVLLVGSLFVFNFLRGIASTAWMPWIAALIPEEEKATFLSRDQIFMFVGAFLSLLLSALLMKGTVAASSYSLVFLVSALAGTAALVFLKRIPDIRSSEQIRNSSEPVPWEKILFYPPFFALLVFNLLFVIVVGSMGVFTVEYLHEFPHFNASEVLTISGVSFLGALAVLPFLGKTLERFNCKPVLAATLVLFGIVIAGWFLVAAGIIPCKRRVIGILNFLSGAAGAGFNVANARIIFATMPQMGRNHFFALFTVISSLGLGAAPVVWGLSLDFIGTYEVVTGALHWKRHSIYFAVLFMLNLLSILQIRRLHESGPDSK
ncbi:MAG: MFS transporter [bacterium]